jgi:hypothetical protein
MALQLYTSLTGRLLLLLLPPPPPPHRQLFFRALYEQVLAHARAHSRKVE